MEDVFLRKMDRPGGRRVLFAVWLLSGGLTCCSPVMGPDLPEDSFGGLHNPIQTALGGKDNEVTWSCIELGAYPAAEVVGGAFDAVDAYAVREGDVIRDAALYARLSEAVWTDGETEIDGHRYRRLNGAGAVSAAGDRAQHYRWFDPDSWHYFAYAPIKWRVLHLSGTQALLLADRMPDVYPFNDEAVDVCWEKSSLRRWLNGEFLDRVFSAEEQAAILTVEV